VKHAQAIRQYLSFGFVPDVGLASAYLSDLFGNPHVPGTADPSKLLVDIVEYCTAGASEVAIPLSGGRDSRAILGAALEIFPARHIHCVTFGSRGSADVEGARAVCRTARVPHRIVDPDTVAWDLDSLRHDMQRRIAEQIGIPPIDGLHIFRALADLIPVEMPVLSGYLGIVAAGKHLGGIPDDDHESVVTRFLEQNRGVIEDRDRSLFTDFLHSHEPLRQKWPGLTKFDLLDFGFRQRLRIRSSVTGSFAKAIRVSEHHRWIRHWFSRPVAERVNFGKYDERLAVAFPLVFGRLPLGSRIRRWRARVRGRGAYRGDPRRNSSMAHALKEACRAFDGRALGLGQSAAAAFERLMSRPSPEAFRTVRWFATAELVAGVQDAPSLE
jgi:Asparagine synthase